MSNCNRRRNVRVDFQSFVDLVFADRVYEQCMTRDLSLKGIFVVGVKGPVHGERCGITLRLVGGSSDMRLSMQGEVMRAEPEGLALHFTEIDLDSFFHLRNIICYNTGDPELLEKEWLEAAQKI